MVTKRILEKAIAAPTGHGPYAAGIKSLRPAIIDAPMEFFGPALTGMSSRYNHMGSAPTFDIRQIEEQFDKLIAIDVIVKPEVRKAKRSCIIYRRIGPKQTRSKQSRLRAKIFTRDMMDHRIPG
jgi:hypothetical protein